MKKVFLSYVVFAMIFNVGSCLAYSQGVEKSNVANFDSVFIPDGHRGLRCEEHLRLLQLMSNDTVIIQGQCEYPVFDRVRVGSKLHSKVIFLAK